MAIKDTNVEAKYLIVCDIVNVIVSYLTESKTVLGYNNTCKRGIKWQQLVSQ